VRNRDLHLHVAHLGIVAAIRDLTERGYNVHVNPANAHSDLVICNTLTIEVKASLWTRHNHSKGRYQFNSQPGADLYILACMTHAPRYFVVPGRVIAGKANVAIWSEYPSKYVGRWTQFCDAWHIIDEELERCTVLDTA